jgi:hypothetical protein
MSHCHFLNSLPQTHIKTTKENTPGSLYMTHSQKKKKKEFAETEGNH